MADFIVVVIVLAVVAAAVAYIIKEKKKGVKCIGCPAAGTCGSHQYVGKSGCGGNCSGNSCNVSSHADTK